jgi:hypothetical protein
MTPQNTDHTPVRIRRDGSIDTAFYLQRGRKMRSEAAHSLAAGSRPRASAAGGILASVIAFLFYRSPVI